MHEMITPAVANRSAFPSDPSDPPAMRRASPVHLAGRTISRVMIVDDSLVIRGVIARILKDHSDIEVVASASNGRLAVDRARRGNIDVVVL